MTFNSFPYTLNFVKEKYKKSFFNKYPNKSEIDFFKEIICEPYKEIPPLKIITDNFICK